ncbi:hypothetical protein GGQ54_000346 [Naumannella cuiyingiana]|uniref:Uncharacterized protein n=1 Tax=Naumannella cuiyingiana TaxID=1347891 RepID=A0A7Z0IJT4_9ACTN|nr:hypothetical protein [Naumannella cuiyingiana]NYI69786.1 hypothetical protein [Naumannella cuiyingiana]
MGFLDWVGRVNDRLEPEGIDAPTVPSDADILNALERTEELARSAGLPSLVLVRVGRVAGLVRDTLPRLRSTGLNTTDSYAVMATATDYLPEALGAYLRLPRDWANTRPVDAGKTSLMLLVDQLDLLGSTMAKVLDAVARTDAAALVAHGRFLTERFGGAPVTRPPQPPAPPRTGNPLDLEGP